MLPLNNRVKLGVCDYHTLDILYSNPSFSVIKASNLALGREEALRISYGSTHTTAELRKLSSLTHPSNLQVYSCGSMNIGGERQVLTMPLLKHNTFAELHIQNLSPLLACRLLGQALGALHEVERAGLVYGNLSPSTLKLSKQVTERLHIADYGLGIPTDDATSAENFRPARQPYVAPERFLGAPPTARGDIFSLGVVFYELLCGELPYPRDGFNLLRAYQDGIRPMPLHELAEVPLALAGLIHGMVAVDPDRRCRTARDVAARLLCLDPDELLAYSPSPMLERTSLGMHIPAPEDDAPEIWVLDDDPAFRQQSTRRVLASLEQAYSLRVLAPEEREAVRDAVMAGEQSLPGVVLFGDLHVILSEPLLEVFRHHSRVSRVLLSTHLNADMVHTAINTCGLDQQILTSMDVDEQHAAIEDMVRRTQTLRSNTPAQATPAHQSLSALPSTPFSQRVHL